MRRVLGIWSVVVSLCIASPARAQVALGSGAIVARVRDASGHALPGALVRVEGPASRDVTTNVAGIGTLVALPAGWYDVSISLAGYATYATRLDVADAATAPQVVAPELERASFADLGNAVGAVPVPELGAGIDPFVAHAFEENASTNVVSAGAGAISIDGTLPNESRVELDGIPFAGGATSAAAFRFRDAIGLAGVDVAEGPFVESPSLRDAIGGIVNLRTPAVDGPAAAGIDDGYDSAFGSFQHARAVEAFGNLALAFDAVAGGGTDRSQTVKARYAFSPSTSLDVASYGLQASGAVGGSDLTASAPAFSAGIRTAAGAGSFEGRAFSSSLATTVSSPSPIVDDERSRTAGFQLGYDLPLGADHVSVSFDRRSENTTLDLATPFAQTFTTVGLRGGFAIARALRLEAADTYSGGTMLPARNDPALALAYRPTGAFALRLSAGSGYATAPDDVLATRAGTLPPLAPETAFGYRLTGDVAFGAERMWIAAYSERRFDAFAALEDAANRGAGVGFARTPGRGFGGLAYVAFVSGDAYGAASPPSRAASFPSLAAESDALGDPHAKGRAMLTYRAGPACESRIGATFVGSDNALSGRALVLGDVSLCLPVFGFANVRVGEENAFGATVADPVLAPLYRPHEFTFSFGVHR